MHTASADRAPVLHRTTGVLSRRLVIRGANGLKRLESQVEHRVLALDLELVMRELVRLLPRTLFQHDDLEPGSGELLCENATRRAGSDDHEVDSISLTERTLLHAAPFAADALDCA